MTSKWRQLILVGFLSFLLAACNSENNDSGDLQNDNPAVDGDDDTEEPAGGEDTNEELEEDVSEDQEED